MLSSTQEQPIDSPAGAERYLTSEPVPSRLAEVAHHQAGHALVCFVLYGAEVVREVALGASPQGAPAIGTYSRLPIPLSCRPVPGKPRRGHAAPVSSEAILDAHGVLSYSGAVAECLLDGLDGSAIGSSDLLNGERLSRFHKDLEKHQTLARMLGMPDLSSQAGHGFVSAYWDEAVRLLSTSWAGVEWVAGELLERGSLSGAQLDSMLVGMN
ncbi:MAG: hypothetical protein CBC48_06035 [bacterium TMED88]|nr:hypothetical protein [Deltaproteobacteria bacterium]OUV34430.1 MAG: hypothetical protein CBC48_06035 [bacterium TMED88]